MTKKITCDGVEFEMLEDGTLKMSVAREWLESHVISPDSTRRLQEWLADHCPSE